MIKAMLDSNVILDALTSREPFNEHAEQLFLMAANDDYDGCITANSMTDIYYLVCKSADMTVAKRALQNLLQLYTIVAVNSDDCEDALEGPIEDFEDSLVAVCARKVQAEYIISRDKAFLRADSPVPVIEPKDFLKKLGKKASPDR